MNKTYCHNGYCEPPRKKDGDDHSPMASLVFFIKIIIILFVFTFVTAVIGEFLIKFFTL